MATKLAEKIIAGEGENSVGEIVMILINKVYERKSLLFLYAFIVHTNKITLIKY